MKPGDFPLHSNRSRAAARTLLTEKQSDYERREVIISNRTDSPSATRWHLDVEEHLAVRVVSIPSGMTLEQGLRLLGGFSDKELSLAAELHPELLTLGTMLMLRGDRGYARWRRTSENRSPSRSFLQKL